MADAAGAPNWNWLDCVDELDVEAATIAASRHFREEEWYFRYHFPGVPVVPGIFLIEAMAHALGVLGSVGGRLRGGEWRHFALLTLESAKFYRLVPAGARAGVEARIDDDDGEIISGRAQVRVGGDLACRARIKLTSAAFGPAQGRHGGEEHDFGLEPYLRRVLAPPLLAALGLT